MGVCIRHNLRLTGLVLGGRAQTPAHARLLVEIRDCPRCGTPRSPSRARIYAMKIHALLVQPDGRAEVREVEPDFRAMKEVVGGWLEAVSSSTDADWVAYCDEEGRLKHLPVNEPATALAHDLGWPGDFLVGPVLFLGNEYVGGEDGYREVDVPERIVEAVGA